MYLVHSILRYPVYKVDITNKHTHRPIHGHMNTKVKITKENKKKTTSTMCLPYGLDLSIFVDHMSNGALIDCLENSDLS